MPDFGRFITHFNHTEFNNIIYINIVKIVTISIVFLIIFNHIIILKTSESINSN